MFCRGEWREKISFPSYSQCFPNVSPCTAKEEGDCDRPVLARIDRRGGGEGKGGARNDFLLSLGSAYPPRRPYHDDYIGRAKSRSFRIPLKRTYMKKREVRDDNELNSSIAVCGKYREKKLSKIIIHFFAPSQKCHLLN